MKKPLTPTQQRGQDGLMEGKDSFHRGHNGPAYRAGHDKINWGKKIKPMSQDPQDRLLGAR